MKQKVLKPVISCLEISLFDKAPFTDKLPLVLPPLPGPQLNKHPRGPIELLRYMKEISQSRI